MRPRIVQAFPQPERDKTHSIETRDPIIASHPQISVPRLRQRPDRILRQPLLSLPGAERERQRALPANDSAAAGFQSPANKIIERRCDGYVAKRPTPAAPAVAQPYLIERRVR